MLWGNDKPRKRKAIPKHIKDEVRKRDGNQCRACGSTENLHLDHVKPFAKGGKDTVRNLQLLCGPHNRAKGTKKLKVNPPPKPVKVKRRNEGSGWFSKLFGK